MKQKTNPAERISVSPVSGRSQDFWTRFKKVPSIKPFPKEPKITLTKKQIEELFNGVELGLESGKLSKEIILSLIDVYSKKSICEIYVHSFSYSSSNSFSHALSYHLNDIRYVLGVKIISLSFEEKMDCLREIVKYGPVLSREELSRLFGIFCHRSGNHRADLLELLSNLPYSTYHILTWASTLPKEQEERIQDLVLDRLQDKNFKVDRSVDDFKHLLPIEKFRKLFLIYLPNSSNRMSLEAAVEVYSKTFGNLKPDEEILQELFECAMYKLKKQDLAYFVAIDGVFQLLPFLDLKKRAELSHELFRLVADNVIRDPGSLQNKMDELFQIIKQSALLPPDDINALADLIMDFVDKLAVFSPNGCRFFTRCIVLNFDSLPAQHTQKILNKYFSYETDPYFFYETQTRVDSWAKVLSALMKVKSPESEKLWEMASHSLSRQLIMTTGNPVKYVEIFLETIRSFPKKHREDLLLSAVLSNDPGLSISALKRSSPINPYKKNSRFWSIAYRNALDILMHGYGHNCDFQELAVKAISLFPKTPVTLWQKLTGTNYRQKLIEKASQSIYENVTALVRHQYLRNKK